MKINYLFSGIDKENGFTEEQSKCLKKDIKNNSIITVIASSFDNQEKNDFYLETTIKWFNDIGIEFKEIYLIDERIDKETAKEYIQKSDIVYLMGGDPFTEMESVKRYSLIDCLRQRDGITIGVSAGSMNQANKVIYKDDKIISYEGIGLTDINIYPHFNMDNQNFVDEVLEVSKEKELIALPNDSFIRIENDNVDYIGIYYTVINGTIDYKVKKI